MKKTVAVHRINCNGSATIGTGVTVHVSMPGWMKSALKRFAEKNGDTMSYTIRSFCRQCITVTK